MFVFFFFPILPAVTLIIPNSILKTENDSFERSLSYKIEYFVDLNEHFLLPLVHTIFSSTLAGLTISALGTSYIVCSYYIIGSFEAIG